ncbi:MAG: hypothetical protein PUB52_02790 [Lachnospiraceae bacterium]|nr:hypothetical protein [Lachnospiraceae bacterium]
MNKRQLSKERYEKVYQAMEPFRAAKKETIHVLAGFGRKHKLLRYPMLAFLAVFIFVYNLFLYALIGLRVQERFAKAVALVMTAALVITSIDLTAFAMTQREKGFYELTELESVEDTVTVSYGTDKSDVPLPESVTAILDFYSIEAVEAGEASSEIAEQTAVDGTDAGQLPSEQTGAAGEEQLPAAEVEAVDVPVVQSAVPDGADGQNSTQDENVLSSADNTDTQGVTEPTGTTDAPETTVPTAGETTTPSDAAAGTDTAGEAGTNEATTAGTTEEITATETPEAAEEATEVEGADGTKEAGTPQYVRTETVQLPLTWNCAEYDGKTPGEYIFTAELPTTYDGYEVHTDGIAALTIKVQVMEPTTLCLSETVDDIAITLTAAPGVFPEDATLSVTKVEDEASIAKIENAIQNNLDEACGDEESQNIVEKTITFDITVLDKKGKEIQPEIPEGMSAQDAVTVTFRQVVPELTVEDAGEETDTEQTMEVYYIDDAMETAQAMNASVEGEDLSFNPEHFSLYTCTCRLSSYKLVSSWTSLYKAVYSKSGTVNIKLADDIEISRRSIYSNSDRLYLKNGQTLNLDLNGHHIYGASGKPAIDVKDGYVYIHDTRGGGTISAPNSSYVVYASGSWAKVFLKGGAISRGGSETYGIYATNGAEIQILGGGVTGSFSYGIYCNSGYSETIKMTSGAIDGANYGVYIGGSTSRGTSFTMTGGSIVNSKNAGIYNNSGVITMTGGTISGNSGYKAYGIRNAGAGRLYIGGAVNFSTNRAADIYVGNNSTNYINVNNTLTGSRIGIETATAPTMTVPVQFTSNAISMEKFYSAANSSYAVWQPNAVSYYVVGPKANCAIVVKPENVKLSTATEEMAGTVAIGTGAGSTTAINTTVKYNAQVTLKATLTNAEEYEFTGWKDVKTGRIVSPDLIYTFTATNDYEYTAEFTKKKYSISVGTSNNVRGTAAITASSPGASGGKYEVGSTVTIKATPASGYQFAQWNDGDTSATREITVTGNAVYTAQFKEPDPDPNATGTLYAGVKKLTGYPSYGTKLLMIHSSVGTMTTTDSNTIAVAGLPKNSALVTYQNDSSGWNVAIQQKGQGFDDCNPGKIALEGSLWYYWCCNGGVQHAGPYNIYSYTASQTFKAGNIKASLNDLQLSADKNSVQEVDLTITIGSYTIKSLIFKDTAIDYSKGDRRIELDLGGVLFTYTLPEAIVVKPSGTRTEYGTLAEAIAAADTASGDKIYMVGSAISEITGSNTVLKEGVTIIANDGSTIEADENSKINASPDGTVELLKGQITATPATDDSNVSVDVDDAKVTANKPITVTAGDDVTKATVTTTEPTSAITISPDGDPNHSVTYVTCPGEKEYGIHSGELTSEDKVIISDGTEYDLKVSLGENQETTIETSSTNPGKTTISKGEGGVVIESEEANNDIKVGDTTFTTSDDTTKLVIKPSESDDTEGGATQKPEVQLEEGSVQVPKDGTITLPNGEKVSNTTTDGNESVTVNDENKISVPDGAEATIGEGDDAFKVSVPKGEPANLPAEITPKEDGSGLEVKAEPGNQVKIGDDEYTIGDYDTTFDISTSKDGTPKVTVSDGGVELKPGQSVTDSNGVTFTNTGDEPIKLAMTEGKDTEVSVGGGKSFTYQEEGKDPVSFTNPGDTKADFSVSDQGVSLNSDMSVPKGQEVSVDFLGNKVGVEVPESNQGNVIIDPTEGTITVQKADDKVIIDGKEYKASTDDTVLAPGADGVELMDGGVNLNPSDKVNVNGTEVKNSGSNPCEVAIGEDGNTKVTVPKNGGFTMTDQTSGASMTFSNPGAETTDYKLDNSGSLMIPENSDVTFKQGNSQTTIGSGAGGATICPSENGVEITAPEGGSIEINGALYVNKGRPTTEGGESGRQPGEELVIAVGTDGTPILESGKTEIPEGQKLGLAGGDVITGKQGSATVDADGNVELSQDEIIEIDRNGKKSSYTAVADDTGLAYDPETGIPTLTSGAVKLDKNSAIDVIFNTIEHGEESELFDEEEKATITSKGTEAPTVASDGTITVPQNGAVDIDSEVTVGTGEGATKKQAHNSIGVPAGAPNESVSVKPKTDGSADVTLSETGDKVVINGMEYTTTEDNTLINMTETGSTLKKGAVALDGGKTPKEGINVNGVCVTNSGAAGSTVSVKVKDNGTTDFEVSAKGQFDLSVPGAPGSAVTFKNPGTDKATYTVETDGSIKLGPDSSIGFQAGQKEIEVAGGEGVSMKVTEKGVAVSVEAGKEVTIDGVTYKTPADKSFTLTIDHIGRPILTKGTVITQENCGVNLLQESGGVLEVKTGSSITVSEDGAIEATCGDTLKIGTGTYTNKDSEGTYKLSVNADTGEVTVDSETANDGINMELANGNLTFPTGTTGGVTISTNGNLPIDVEKAAGTAKPKVTVPAGGNVTIGDKSTGKGVEIKVPADVTEDKQVTIDETGNLSITLKAGEQITVGGIVYTAEQNGTLTVNGQSGKLVTSTIVPEESASVPSIDPSSFNKENYSYDLGAGESVKVGDTVYTAPEGGMTLIGNENGNPIIGVTNPNAEVQIGSETYKTGNAETKFVVNAPNDITLVDNGNASANSSLIVEGAKTMTIDGNTVQSSGSEDAGYEMMKAADGDVLDIKEGTKLSVAMGTGSNGLVVNEPLTMNNQTTTQSTTKITPSGKGTSIVLDKTTQDEEENYITKLSASGYTVLTPVLDEEGNLVGFGASLNLPKPTPPQSDSSSSDSDTTPEVIPPTEEVEETPAETTGKKPSTGTQKEPETATEPDDNSNETEDESGNETDAQEAQIVQIETVEEAADITITGNVQVQLSEGEIYIHATSEGGRISGNLQDILTACFTPEQIEEIQAGKTAEVRSYIARVTEDVAEDDKNVMQKQFQTYEQSLDGLEFGCYVEIIVESRVGDGEWEQLHELNEELEMVLDVPENLYHENRTFFIMRNHEGTCTILEDLDDDATTITIRTDRFSTYAILYTDEDVSGVDISELNPGEGIHPGVIVGICLAIMLILFAAAFFIYTSRKRRRSAF